MTSDTVTLRRVLAKHNTRMISNHELKLENFLSNPTNDQFSLNPKTTKATKMSPQRH